MRVLPPITITPAMLTTPAVAEPDTAAGEVAWASGGTFVVGDRRISTTTHRAYICIQAHSVDHNPATDTAGQYWQDDGPTNRWAMFDLLRNTGTTKASSMTVVLTPGQRFDAIGVTGIVADTITIEQKLGGATIYSFTANLLNRPTLGWYDYFFGPFRYRQEIALFDLRPDSGTTITITLTKATGNVVCGGVVIGRSVYLGRTLHNAEAGATNFSKINRDDFGTAILVPRRSVPKTTQTVRLYKAEVDRVRLVLDDLNAVPALWSGLDDQDSGYFAALLIVGIYKNATINFDQPNEAILSLELEEI